MVIKCARRPAWVLNSTPDDEACFKVSLRTLLRLSPLTSVAQVMARQASILGTRRISRHTLPLRGIQSFIPGRCAHYLETGKRLFVVATRWFTTTSAKPWRQPTTRAG